MTEFRSYTLADLCYPDIQEYLKTKDLILIPMASTEQHGPHLPLKTDTVTAEEVARRVAQQIQVLYTPCIWMGYSPQHLHRSEERRVGKSVDLGGRRIIKKKRSKENG